VRRADLLLVVVLGLASRAPEVVRESAVLTPMSGLPASTIEIQKETVVDSLCC